MIMTTSLLLGSLVLACLLGILFGYWLAGRKNDNGKDKARISELEISLQEYKEQVHQHFSTTASLFQDLGHNYRTLYNYMAESANELCPEIPDTAALQFDATNLLPEQAQANVEETAQAPSSAVTDSPQPEQKSATPADSPAAAVEDTDATTKQAENAVTTSETVSDNVNTATVPIETVATKEQTNAQNPETQQTTGTEQAKTRNL